MPSGVGATTVRNDPSLQGIDFIENPVAFFESTERNVGTRKTFSTPGPGAFEEWEVPNTGLLAEIAIQFIGTLTVTHNTGSVTSGARWPYGLLALLQVGLNAQNDLISAIGEDLVVLDQVNNPSQYRAADDLDVIPGAIGPGNTIPTGASDVILNWVVPVVIDPTTLIGGVYAQSPQTHVGVRFQEAVTADLVVASGDATVDSLSGTWHIETTIFDIPIAPTERPAVIVPDVRRFHLLQGRNTAFDATGEVGPVMLGRANGQLDRLFARIARTNPAGSTSGTTFLRADPDLDELDAFRLEYGVSERPLDYNPASFLLGKNLRAYGERLAYEYLVLDLLATNPPRDIIQIPGVSELRVVPTVNAGVTVASGAHVRLVQEMLV